MKKQSSIADLVCCVGLLAECIAPRSPLNDGPSVAESERAVSRPLLLSSRTLLACCGPLQDSHFHRSVGTPI